MDEATLFSSLDIEELKIWSEALLISLEESTLGTTYKTEKEKFKQWKK